MRMTNRERAKAWLKQNGLTNGRSDWAHDRDVQSLAKLLDEVAGAAAAGENRCTRNAGHEDESWPGRPGPGGP